MPSRSSRRRGPATSGRSPAGRILPTGPLSTTYATVELTTDTADPHGVMVLLDGAESSHLDLVDPRRLLFEYMQQMLAVLEEVLDDEARPRAVHLGAAGCALPRAVDATWPGSRQIAVEIDARLAEYVRQWFDLPRSPALRIRVADAREAVEGLHPGSKDVVVRDVFADRRPPPHVCTVEFTQAVAAALDPGGIYLLNTADRPPLDRARREVATVREVFEHVGVIAEPAVLKGRRYGNVVALGSARPLPVSALDRRMRTLPVPASFLSGRQVAEFVGTFPALRD
ncbi:fused MFS/spermidine synthase [Ruania alkalisoli]|uniref:Fused MFS/spermidine synthase n=1 Tax=Ruania alkalisoli TaxID=2779775 RepID=A0A7M1SX23_9MICO|nr:fused MFS/spermidine synthase [Ruania alkalisoli]QOR72136.1 fused MFS/spermidine synthase [Ruania alkalisoli]